METIGWHRAAFPGDALVAGDQPQAAVGRGPDLAPRPVVEPGAASRSGHGDNGQPRSTKRTATQDEYTADEIRELQSLRARDREVRSHELAHLAAAGPHARGGARFSFETGPDGRRYAVAGEVAIDTAKIPGDPSATLAKARQVRRAALAPADPSAQDRRIASQATAMAAEAAAELARERRTAAQSESVAQTYAADSATATPSIDLVA